MSFCLINHFEDLADPRIERNKLHALEDIVVLTICATVSGSDGWEVPDGEGVALWCV
jgi:hypothetical protein